MTADATGGAEAGPDLYRDYNAWKGWGGEDFMCPSPHERAYLDAELDGCPVTGERVLDIGFGNGDVLAWAQERGAREVFGSELNPATVEAARARGVRILPTGFGQWDEAPAGGFGTITAFDVLEHLSVDQIRALLDGIVVLLRPGGRFVARFPNGQSPFAGVYQSADMTHVTMLSGPMLVQIAAGRPLRKIRVAEMRDGRSSGARRLLSIAKAAARNAVAAAARNLYAVHSPIGPNVVVVLERTDDTP